MTSLPSEASSESGPASERPNINSGRRIELALTLTPTDVFQASLALTWRSLVRIVGVLLLLAILLVIVDSRGPRMAVLDPIVAGVLGVAVFLGPVYVWLVYIRSRRAFRSSRVYGGPLSYVLTEKGLEVKGATNAATSDWSNVASARETRSLFIMCPPTSAMTIIPKRFLPDSAAVLTLRELIRDHVSGKVILNQAAAVVHH